MRRVLLLLFGCIFLVGNLNSILGAFPEPQLEVATRQFVAKNILNYGDTCSVSDEQKRKELNDNMMTIMTSMGSDYSNLNSLAQSIQTLNSNTGNFCNSLKMLECQANGKCGCSTSEVMGIRISSSREGNHCRLNRGSTCVPIENLALMGPQGADLLCRVRTTCLFKKDGSTCTQDKITAEVMGSLDTARGFPDQGTLMNTVVEKMRDGLCECG